MTVSCTATPNVSLAFVTVTACGRAGTGPRGRRKFPDGERHAAEQLAGIGGIVGDTFLVGNDKLGGMNQILRRADQAHQGEQPQRNNQTSVSLRYVVTNLCA